MSLRLHLLRHGETTYSREGGFCGSLDPELTGQGEQMAEAFAQANRLVAWSAVFASPMKRTVATAQPLCAATGLPMELRDGLKEIAYGDWEGLTQEEARARWPHEYELWLAEPAWFPPPGGETAAQVAGRAGAVLSEILEQFPSGNVLVVTHKATLRILLCGLLGIELARYRDRVGAPAGSVSVVLFTERGPLLETLGDRCYMSEELRGRPGT